MRNYIILILMTFSLNAISQNIVSPPMQNNFLQFSSYDQITGFVKGIEKANTFVTSEIIGKSVKGRNLYAIKFSKGKFGTDNSKIKVLILAQQHGNEQSGKEGALLLAEKLCDKSYSYLFDKIDLAIIPQMNPDGSEANKRLNGNGMDLNRNHLIMTEPEIQALHAFYDRYMFEATLDVHEYYPYGDTWKKTGVRPGTDEFIGPLNNPNISSAIIQFSNKEYLPYIIGYLALKQFKGFIYSPGGPPSEGYIRHSTFDINDGRQSFGIQNSFSFIQEGLNGIDYTPANLKHRAEGQMTGMLGMLEFCSNHSDQIIKMVHNGRKQLVNKPVNWKIALQCVHSSNGSKLLLPVYSYHSGCDTVITVDDYRPVVKTTYEVTLPDGYLVPLDSKELTGWVKRIGFRTEEIKKDKILAIEQYNIGRIDSIDFEGDATADAQVTVSKLSADKVDKGYIYIPVRQVKGSMLAIALEPKSILGIGTYKEFSYLLKSDTKYPVLRLIYKH